MFYKIGLFLSLGIIGCADKPVALSNSSGALSGKSEALDNAPTIQATPKTQALTFRLLGILERKSPVFTQGFYYFAPNLILESSGLYGQSFIQYYDLSGARSKKKLALPKEIFAEGLTYKPPYIYLLTWKEGRILVLDTNFRLQKTLAFAHEGWGITHNQQDFIISTGSDSLYFYDQNFQFKHAVGVYYPENHQRVMNLNELECVNGFIFANIWQQDRIVKIDPQSGAVVGYLDLGELIDAYLARKADGRMQDAVLNGIAWDKTQGLMYVTGKLWPMIFVLKLL